MSGRNPRLEVKRQARRYATDARETLSRVSYATHAEPGPVSLEDWQRFEGAARRARDLADALVSLCEVMGRIETAGQGALSIGDRRFVIPLIPTQEGTQ